MGDRDIRVRRGGWKSANSLITEINTDQIADAAVTTDELGTSAVTYEKIQDVSATDKVLGRSSAGSGDVEEIPCTAFGRSLLEDANATEHFATIGTIPVSAGGTGQTNANEAMGELIQAMSHQDSIDRFNDIIPSYDASGDSGESLYPYEVAGSAVVANGTVSGAGSLDLALDYAPFRMFKLYIYDLVPQTDATIPYLRFSDDGGASFEADAADYDWANSVAIDSSDSEIELTSTVLVGNATDEAAEIEITIYNPGGSSRTRIFATMTFNRSDTGALSNISCIAQTLWGGPATDIRLLMSSGNLSCGYTLVGFM